MFVDVPGAAAADPGTAVSLGAQVLFVFLHDVAGDFDALVAVVEWDHEVLVCGDDECVGEYKRLANSYARLSCPVTSSTHRYSLTISGDAETIPPGRHRTLARLLLDTAGAIGRVIK